MIVRSAASGFVTSRLASSAEILNQSSPGTVHECSWKSALNRVMVAFAP
ncbi:MAG: hypothetical protein NTX45_00550 [Proteobacteria bacterium]|nr:hypothetical protein [Pseudomonadota bacterium]